MNVLAWILQIVLALVFLASGGMKLARPPATLRSNPQMAWANDFSDTNIKLIGVAEVLGAIGLVVPWLLDIAPVLTPLAAVGLVIVMAGAAVTHGRRKEWPMIAVIVVLGVLALIVAVVRF